jgi:hypothetical protein
MLTRPAVALRRGPSQTPADGVPSGERARRRLPRSCTMPLMEIEDMDLEELTAKCDELSAMAAVRHDCQPHLSLRRRTVAGGAIHFVNQCQECGRQVAGPLSKAAALQDLGAAVAPMFDEQIHEDWLSGRRALHSDLSAVSLRIALLTDPEGVQDMLDSQRETVESGERAQLALDAVAAAVQHFTHAHRMPFIIRYLQVRHPATFGNPNAGAPGLFESEPELRQWLDTWLHEDFDVHPEVPGRHVASGTRVQIDYILVPKAPLVAKGFDAAPLGLEAKFLPLEGFSPRASRFVWQAVSYTDAEFDLNGTAVRPRRVLLFSNMSFELDRGLLKSHDSSGFANDLAKWHALLELANHAGVGNLEIYGTRERRAGWRIAFASGVYFRKTRDEYSLRNARLFEKERIGNF